MLRFFDSEKRINFSMDNERFEGSFWALILNPAPYLISEPVEPLSLVANSIRANNGAQEARINAHFIKGPRE